MSQDQYIPLQNLCRTYEVEMSFFSKLNEFGLIEMITIEESYCVPVDSVHQIEKIIRMNQDLNINLEGIDAILNLLERIEELEEELRGRGHRG